MSREARPRIFHRCVTTLVSGTVALTLAAAPSLAQAAQPTLLASNIPTTDMKLRSIMSLQDPAADPAAAPADPAAPVASATVAGLFAAGECGVCICPWREQTWHELIA